MDFSNNLFISQDHLNHEVGLYTYLGQGLLADKICQWVKDCYKNVFDFYVNSGYSALFRARNSNMWLFLDPQSVFVNIPNLIGRYADGPGCHTEYESIKSIIKKSFDAWDCNLRYDLSDFYFTFDQIIKQQKKLNEMRSKFTERGFNTGVDFSQKTIAIKSIITDKINIHFNIVENKTGCLESITIDYFNQMADFLINKNSAFLSVMRHVISQGLEVSINIMLNPLISHSKLIIRTFDELIDSCEIYYK